MNEVFRAEVGLICGSLVRITGDFDLAEDLVQDAVVAALQRWPLDGVPERPAAWLLQTARRRAIDRLRRDATYRSKLQLLTDGWAPDVRSDPDDRLRLIFICCHPALARDAQVALTLRAVMGMTTSQIAHAFLVSEATMAQRIVRAKRKIVGARIPYRVPEPEELTDRLAKVLASLYIVFNEGYLGSGPDVATSRPLRRRALALRIAGAHAARGVRGPGTPRTDAAPRVAAGHTLRCGREARAAQGPGPLALGPRGNRRGRRTSRAGTPSRPPGLVLAPGGDRRLSRGSTDF
jgi:RNA polymerase sigma-70 factor (ECF subfamily)